MAEARLLGMCVAATAANEPRSAQGSSTAESIILYASTPVGTVAGTQSSRRRSFYGCCRHLLSVSHQYLTDREMLIASDSVCVKSPDGAIVFLPRCLLEPIG
eukprot:4571671-Pyramimonas_sp.AAC.1